MSRKRMSKPVIKVRMNPRSMVEEIARKNAIKREVDRKRVMYRKLPVKVAELKFLSKE